MKPKILIFSLGYYPKHIGGAEVAIKEITDRLADSYDFHLICNRYDTTLPKTETVGSVVVHRIGLATKNPSMADLRKLPLHLNKVLYQFLAVTKAKKLHKQHNFNGTWAMMAHATGVPAAKFKALFPSVPYLLTLQEGDPPALIESKMRLFQPWFNKSFTTADMIQVISSFLGDWAEQKGFEKNPVLIPNAVNVKHFSQTFSEQSRSKVRSEWGISDDKTVLITTSRLVHKNGIDTVIESLPELENTHFVVYGTGPDKEKLKSLTQKLEVTYRVHFLGHVDHSQLPEYLKAADIFIRPSRSEGMGNSFLEAMAAGIPVIATQEGGIIDFLFDEKQNPEQTTTGWAVSASDPDTIVLAVQEIWNTSEKVARVTNDAKAMVIDKYDWELIANRMKNEVFIPLLSQRD